MSEVKFEIVEHLATLGTSNSNWTLELNKVSWNDRQPVYDLRSWNSEHTKCSKGTTLNEEEYANLCNFMKGC